MRGRALGLDLGKSRVKLDEFPVERDHGTPFVQARQEHGPDVDFPRQKRRVRRGEQLDGDQHRGRRQRDENDCPVQFEHQQHAFRTRCTRRREHAAAPQHLELRAENVHIPAEALTVGTSCWPGTAGAAGRSVFIVVNVQRADVRCYFYGFFLNFIILPKGYDYLAFTGRT